MSRPEKPPGHDDTPDDAGDQPQAQTPVRRSVTSVLLPAGAVLHVDVVSPGPVDAVSEINMGIKFRNSRSRVAQPSENNLTLLGVLCEFKIYVHKRTGRQNIQIMNFAQTSHRCRHRALREMHRI